MSFILKIYFMGMIAFVPSGDGQEMTILLQDVRDGHYASDGSHIDTHLPMLIARSSACSGDCLDDLEPVAMHLFKGAEGVARGDEMTHLEGAIGNGAALVLDGSDLGVESVDLNIEPQRGGVTIFSPLSTSAQMDRNVFPRTSEEQGDFSLIASMGAIAPELAEIDPQLMGENPGATGLIIGRLRLDQGEIRTHSLVQYGGKIAPLSFRRLGDSSRSGEPVGPLGDSAVVEIPVAGCEVYFRERKFSGEPGRVIRLAPESCEGGEVLEVALLNLPPRGAHDQNRREGNAASHRSATVGTHFELFYELAARRPPVRQRPVPHVAEAPQGVTIPPQRRTGAPDGLLDRLGLGAFRGGYSASICPLSQYP